MLSAEPSVPCTNTRGRLLVSQSASSTVTGHGGVSLVASSSPAPQANTSILATMTNARGGTRIRCRQALIVDLAKWRHLDFCPHLCQGATRFALASATCRGGNPMGLLTVIIVGGIIGWIASMAMKTNAQMGMIANVVVGIIGASLGAWLAGALGVAAQSGLGSVLISIVGACVLIAILKALNIFK